MWPPRWRSRTACIAPTWTPCGWATRIWRCWSRCGAKEAAERSNLEKSRFLAAASHDLRQPVLAVSLFLGLLTNEKLTAHGRYLVDNIASATAAMGHLFDALLNISRLDAGVIEPRRKWFPLNPLLEQLRAEYAAGVQKACRCGSGPARRW